MFLQPLSLILLIGNVFTAPLKSQNIYDECKNQIISYTEKNYKEHPKIFVEDNEILSVVKCSLFRIDANVLLDLLLADNSDKFLVIIFFAYYDISFIVFHDIGSLSHLKGFPRKDIPLKKIFKNYRRFLLRTFIRVKDECFCSNSPNRSTGFDLLRKFESFWDNRLAHLARQLLSKEEYVEELIQFKSRIRFLDIFLNNDFESLMVYEFKRLHKVFQKIDVENPTSVENFIFLSEHLGLHLKNISSPELAKFLNFLASQIPEFIVYFFYFYQMKLVTSLKDRSKLKYSSTSRNIRIVLHNFSWDKITLRLFAKSILHPKIQIAELADVIKTKIETFETENGTE
jgi:hypothetical protein